MLSFVRRYRRSCLLFDRIATNRTLLIAADHQQQVCGQPLLKNTARVQRGRESLGGLSAYRRMRNRSICPLYVSHMQTHLRANLHRKHAQNAMRCWLRRLLMNIDDHAFATTNTDTTAHDPLRFRGSEYYHTWKLIALGRS